MAAWCDTAPVSRRQLMLASLTLAGCSLPRPTRVPMDRIEIAGPCATPASRLLVMLPGAYSRPQEFIDNGFVETLRQRGVDADVVIADAHLGYYDERSVLVRLRDDIVLPARARGYRDVWLVGISIGAFGAMGYAARRLSPVDGIVAIAPYLGRRALLDEIEADGGPRPWSRQSHAHPDDDLEREIWSWLAAPPADAPPVVLGFGRDDRFAPAQRLAATLLPAGRSFDTPGGHDWKPWRTLWNQWLDGRPFGAGCVR